MNATGLATFDTTLHTTNIWLNELMQQLGWSDRHKAYHALRVVLHALRDRLPVNEAVQLGAQLPMLVRGIYYEGWRPAGKPVKEHTSDEFLTHVTDAFLFDVHADSTAIATAVLGVLAKHVSSGEIDDIKHELPADIRQLCP